MLSLATRYQLVATALLAGACLWRMPQAATGVGLGGLTITFNLALSRYLTERVMGNERPKTVYVVALGLKFVLMLALVGGILFSLRPHVPGFALGLGTYFMGVTLAVLHQARLAQRPSA